MILASILQFSVTSAFTSAFVSSSSSDGSRFGIPIPEQQHPRCLNVVRARFTPLASDATGPTVQLDAKGKEVEVGTIVRVVVNHLKAYQVSLPGYGSYGPDKKFVAAPPGGTRGTKNLLLPIGIRGVVTKVYNVDDVSANHPIQVKFFPGKHVDEGFDPPVPFIMHFSPEEIECV
jgi:hypothetical protein